MLKRLLTRTTHKIYTLPVMVLMPHSRCNCRCVMCDIWKANHNKKEITPGELARHIDAFKKLGVKQVALSGGEALMHTNLWKFCALLKGIGIKISLLSTGVSLKAHAAAVIQWCDDVIVSLDGGKEVHDQIRNIPRAFEKLEEGVGAIKTLNPAFRVTGRTVLQKLNFRNFPEIVLTAKKLGLDQISFLAADISSSAFNRPEAWQEDKVVQIGLSEEETNELEAILKTSFTHFKDLYDQRFIAESPEKMLSLVQYYRATLGLSSFPKRTCNAPWVSAVIESDGEVRPCFFHPSYGNIYQQEFEAIINAPAAIAFRKNLNMAEDATCRRCVCSLHIGLRQAV
jgi:Fe-coproporphyrin III synthase